MGTDLIQRVLEETLENLLPSIAFRIEATENSPDPSKDQAHLSDIPPITHTFKIEKETYVKILMESHS